MTSKEVLEKQKEIELLISKLEIELKELKKNVKTLQFIELLREVLLNDKCTIILQGHNEWQFQEKYNVKDINFVYRKKIAKSLHEIIKEIENE